MNNSWNPDYLSIYKWRQRVILQWRNNPQLVRGAREYYRKNPVDFINHWCNTYDPRNLGTGKPTSMPFILYPRQVDFVNFVQAMIEGKECGLVEKCRAVGATWVCSAISVWLWAFNNDAAIGWGSKKQELVDALGDADSILEKVRIIIRNMPRELLPRGFDLKKNMGHMKIVSPATNSTITGEVGDEIGRGGRKLIMFKDESAHYKRPLTIEAALSETAPVQIDISSVNGLGNVFHSKRIAGVEWNGGKAHKNKINVFIFDWKDNPQNTQKWYDERKKKFIEMGQASVFAQEVDRDYAASVEGVIILAKWVDAAIDAHIKLSWDDCETWQAALDVADDGEGDINAFTGRQGSVLRRCEGWGGHDTGETARKAMGYCEDMAKVSMQYDCIGVGAGVKAEYNRLRKDTDIAGRIKNIRFIPWNAASSPLNKDKRLIKGDKDTPLIGDYYENIKAQAWQELALRFERTYRAINEGISYKQDDLISIDSSINNLHTLKMELSQAVMKKTKNLKLMVDKTPSGTSSPNYADSVVMNYWPVDVKKYTLDNL